MYKLTVSFDTEIMVKPSKGYILAVGLIVELALLTQVFAQQPFNLYPETQYVYKNWNNESGLPQNTVFDILEDDQGFLWVATEEGVARFDGNEFKIIDKNTHPVLQSDYFIDLSASQSGGIWAASRNDILKIDGHYTRRYNFNDHIEGAWISYLFEDDDGILWVGTDAGNLFTLTDGNIQQPLNWSSEMKGAIQVIRTIGEHLLIGTNTGLYKLEDKSGEAELMPEFNSWNIRTLIAGKDGSFWTGTEEQGLFHKTPDKTVQYTEADGLPEKFITSLGMDSEGSLWIGTSSSGLYVLDDEKFRNGDKDGFLNDDIKSIYISDQNMVWLGTTGSGLIQMREADIYKLSGDLGLSNDIILPVYQHTETDIWMGTAGKGIYRIRNGKVLRYTRDDGLINEIVLTIYGTEKSIYVGTAGGLSRYNLDTERFDKHYTTSDGLVSNITQAVYQDSNENIWVATYAGGIHILNNESFNKLDLPKELGNTTFLNFFEDRNEHIWVGTNGSGMLCINSKLQIEHYYREQDLPFEIVHDFHEDQKGTLWLATDNGLAYFDNNEFGVADRSNGLKFDHIYRIIDDGWGSLWVSGNFGLQRMSLIELQEMVREGESDYQLSVRLFDQSDGMVNSEANGGIFPAGWKMQDGTIWFPTVDGVAVVRPQKIKEYSGSVEPHIESIRFSNSEFNPGEDISVPAGVYNIEIDYTTIEFTNPSSVNFSYRLKELTDEWEKAEKRRTAYFTTLDPGRYTFEVRAEQYGKISEPVNLSFDVAPFFYQTWWFRIALIMVLFGAGYLVNQLYSKYQKESQLKFLVDERTKDLQHALNEKDVLIKEVHHRVKNNLAIISGLMEMQKYATDNKELHKAFYASQSRIRSIALIHEQLYQLENFSKLDFKVVLENLLRNISDLYAAEEEISHELELETVELNVNQAIPVAMFANEVCVNSYKHAFKNRKSGSLFISLKENGERVTLKFMDDGLGMAREFDFDKETSDSLGFQLIKILSQQLNADLKLITKGGTGYILEFEKSNKKGSASGII